jgi:hypothetical protein
MEEITFNKVLSIVSNTIFEQFEYINPSLSGQVILEFQQLLYQQEERSVLGGFVIFESLLDSPYNRKKSLLSKTVVRSSLLLTISAMKTENAMIPLVSF